MASKLCCITEQDSRPNSPELPNVRLSTATPAKQPLLPKTPASLNSRFTSVRSDEFNELHQIFDHAQDAAGDRGTPTQALRARFSRASVYSLRSLHKMTSVRSLLKRRFSRDLARKEPGMQIHIEATQRVTMSDHDTVIKTSNNKAIQQLKVTKEHLRRDLLSDKKPHKGGYDSDAEVLDDLAKNLGKRTPSKRASIHSVNWSPSTDRATPESSTKSRANGGHDRDLEPYQVQKHRPVSLAARVGHVFSTPNFRVDVSDGRDRAFRRSHSAASIGLPQVSPLAPISPLQLPGLTDFEQDGVPWAETITESLRLSQFPVPPRFVSTQPSQTLLPLHELRKTAERADTLSKVSAGASSGRSSDTAIAAIVKPVEIRIQRPTSIASPRLSTSTRGNLPENVQPPKTPGAEEVECEDDGNPRRSVHLYSMRISHHLRSGSLLSWEKLADASEHSSSQPSHHQEATLRGSQVPKLHNQSGLHDQRVSSTGLTSTEMPPRRDTILTELDMQGDVTSSIYSSRPQSRPNSFVTSSVDPEQAHTCPCETPSPFQTGHISPLSSTPERGDTLQTIHRHERLRSRKGQLCPEASSSQNMPLSLARKNSVANTKKSKFREELSLFPPQKTVVHAGSIMKFLGSKRLSGRSQSETSLDLCHPIRSGDATFDSLNVPNKRERRHSQSMMSFQTEQQALNKDRRASRVWDQALKAHQEEKASLLLPANRDLASHAGPFRERSGSIMSRRSVTEGSHLIGATTPDASNVSESLAAPAFSSPFAPRPSSRAKSPGPGPVARRSAMAEASRDDLDREVSAIFEKQGDGSEIVGAWGGYPSHTRDERNNSASKSDRVESRDFALEAAIQFASIRDVDEDLIDPAARVPSIPLMPGEAKKKKKLGSGRMTKSSSMTFGKTFFKNYSRIFKSSSAEFRKHGRGHRSSIAAGGVLEYPELEILPEGWNKAQSVDGGSDGEHQRHVLATQHGTCDDKEANELEARDSMVTLRPRRNSSAPNLSIPAGDGTADDKHAQDNARVWSVYYDDCIPSYPRASTDFQVEKDDLVFARFSFESSAPSMRSRTERGRRARHSRNASHISRASIAHRRSPHQSLQSKGDADDMVEKRSLISVRRSTMDLLSMFKEQEDVEREKIFSITGAGRNKGSGSLSAL